MKIRFLRHAVSEGLNNLAIALQQEGYDVAKLKLTGSTYRGFPTHQVINWGSSNRGSIRINTPILNNPLNISNASNKKKFFETLFETDIGGHVVPFTTSISEAQMWLDQGFSVYGRTVLQGTQGDGIKIYNPGDEIEAAPLYTRKIDIERELRVHVFNGEVIDFSQKKRVGKSKRSELGIDLNEDIRNTKNGWVFARQGVQIDSQIEEVCIKAVSHLGLDFGAIDLAISDTVPKLFEVNTAPGLEGTTVDSYKNAIIKHISNRS